MCTGFRAIASEPLKFRNVPRTRRRRSALAPLLACGVRIEGELFQTQGLTAIVKWLAVGAISIDVGLVIFILSRRAAHNRFYSRKDAAQKRFSVIIAECFAGRLSSERATPLLKAGGRPEREAARTLLLGSIRATTQRQATDLLVALGFVRQWAEQAFGKRRAQQLLRSIAQDKGISALATNVPAAPDRASPPLACVLHFAGGCRQPSGAVIAGVLQLFYARSFTRPVALCRPHGVGIHRAQPHSEWPAHPAGRTSPIRGRRNRTPYTVDPDCSGAVSGLGAAAHHALFETRQSALPVPGRQQHSRDVRQGGIAAPRRFGISSRTAPLVSGGGRARRVSRMCAPAVPV